MNKGVDKAHEGQRRVYESTPTQGEVADQGREALESAKDTAVQAKCAPLLICVISSYHLQHVCGFRLNYLGSCNMRRVESLLFLVQVVLGSSASACTGFLCMQHMQIGLGRDRCAAYMHSSVYWVQTRRFCSGAARLTEADPCAGTLWWAA